MYLFLTLVIALCTAQCQGSDLYTVYAHSIVDTPKQIKRFTDAIITPDHQTTSVTFLDTQKETGYGINRLISEITTYTKKPINRSKMHMAGAQDIQELHKTIESIPQNNNIILFGCSRGAATVINELGQNNPANIIAIILDASPANMSETIHPALAKLGIHTSYDKTIFSTLFPKHEKETITPLESIKKIKDKNLPILLIHSQDDSKVPYSHSLRLYKTFLENGFKHVYLATISQGRHAFLLQDPQIKDIYLQAVHSFYKIHNLPFNEKYAQNDITLYQPRIDDIEKKIKEFEEVLQKEYQTSLYRNIIILGLTLAACFLIYSAKKSNK